MSLCRTQSACSTAAPRARPVSRRRVVMAAANTEVPPNVAEARAWIAAWRAKQQQAAAPAASSGNGTGKAGKAAAAPAGGKLAAASSADGTLVFTADQLKAVSYADVLKGKGGKKK